MGRVAGVAHTLSNLEQFVTMLLAIFLICLPIMIVSMIHHGSWKVVSFALSLAPEDEESAGIWFVGVLIALAAVICLNLSLVQEFLDGI